MGADINNHSLTHTSLPALILYQKQKEKKTMVYLQSLVMAQIMPVVVVASMAVSLILKMPGTFAMGFFSTAVNGLKTVITAIGAGIGIWGGINILESYSSGNPNEKTQGIKQLMSGGGIILLAQTVIPLLSGLFSTTEGGGEGGGE